MQCNIKAASKSEAEEELRYKIDIKRIDLLEGKEQSNPNTYNDFNVESLKEMFGMNL